MGCAAAQPAQPNRKRMNMSDENRIEIAPWDKVLIISITPEQEAAIRAEAAEAGADPARYLWAKIQNTPGMLVIPPARAG